MMSQTWVIGDQLKDIQLAKENGASFVLFLNKASAKKFSEILALKPQYIVSNLQYASAYILASRFENKTVSRKKLGEVVQRERNNKKTIVTLNGTFDILHQGHEKILSEAKAEGDILIVALNADASVKKNKGSSRPFNDEKSRLRMMASFPYVDYVTLFSESTPLEFLKIVQPDVHVNGSDYGENCLEAPFVKSYGGRIHIVKLLDGFSTTSLLQRLGLNL